MRPAARKNVLPRDALPFFPPSVLPSGRAGASRRAVKGKGRVCPGGSGTPAGRGDVQAGKCGAAAAGGDGGRGEESGKAAGEIMVTAEGTEPGCVEGVERKYIYIANYIRNMPPSLP